MSVLSCVVNLFGYKKLSLDYYYNSLKDAYNKDIARMWKFIYFKWNDTSGYPRIRTRPGAVDYYYFIGCMCLLVGLSFRNGTDETLM